MLDPYTNYVVDLLRRIDNKYDALFDHLRRVDNDLKTLEEVIKQRDEERRSYEKLVFEMLSKGVNYSYIPKCLQDHKVDVARKSSERVKIGEIGNKANNSSMLNSKSLGEDTMKGLGEICKSKLENPLNDGLAKEDITPVHNSRERENTLSLKSATMHLQPCMQSFTTVGESSKSFHSYSKDIYIRKSGNGKEICSEGGKSTIDGSLIPKWENDVKENSIKNSPFSRRLANKDGPKLNGSGSERNLIRGFSTKGTYKVGPYNVCIARIVPQDIAIVEYIFAENMDPKEFIVETEYNYLQREMICSLFPGKFLYDEIINIMAELLTFSEIANSTVRRNWFITTRLTALKINLSMSETRRKNYMFNFFMGDLAECRNIFIPINQDYHWLLFIVRVDIGIVEIWDSLLNDGESKGRSLVEEVMTKLDFYLASDIRTYKVEGWSFTNFKVVTHKIAPQQSNGSDCGIFVINFMEQRDLNRLPYFTDDERVRLVLKIFGNDMNKVRSQICEASMKHYRQLGHDVMLPSKRKHGNISKSYFGRNK